MSSLSSKSTEFSEVSSALLLPTGVALVALFALAGLAHLPSLTGVVPLVAFLVALVVLCFARIHVTVAPDQLRAQFVLPHPRRVLRVDEVSGVRSVDIPFWSGWGIRVIGRRATLWRGAGKRGLEFTCEDGSRLILGCKDTGELRRTLAQHSSWSALLDEGTNQED